MQIAETVGALGDSRRRCTRERGFYRSETGASQATVSCAPGQRHDQKLHLFPFGRPAGALCVGRLIHASCMQLNMRWSNYVK
jgi:hypothetical protein